MFQVLDGPGGERCAARLKVRDAAGQLVHEGTTKDERFDGNDHLVIHLPKDQTLQVEADYKQRSTTTQITTDTDGQTVTLELDPADVNQETVDDSSGAVDSLKAYLDTPDDQRKELSQQLFARVPLGERKPGLQRTCCGRITFGEFGRHERRN